YAAGGSFAAGGGQPTGKRHGAHDSWRGQPCFSSLPAGKQLATMRIAPLVPTGCTAGTTGLITNGSRGRKLVALTFDDGPSTYTNGFLDLLADHKVRATFYVLGENVSRYPEQARRIVAEGHEIANHTMHHGFYPGRGDLRQTSSLITATTGFRPCTFRPPGGAYNSGVINAAAAVGGMPTVMWDVDTNDWRQPGSGAIRSSITGARSGSIVLMHDGGGPRGQTLSALGGAIRTLKQRGYRFTTVAELLGGRLHVAARR
ncbi:MAG TPA: polysaccharide deacetylase family protein, partial [Solirubrobacterales bacterium]|nr:polysaccharide deacetylase family protein [Solirubrobacterales bacterium]